MLEDKVDVGCAATNVLEQFEDPETGELLDYQNDFRILSPVEDPRLPDGQEFPFLISSDLVPGYVITAMPHVDRRVQLLFQQELINMVDHADPAPSLLACIEFQGCFLNNTACIQECWDAIPADSIKRCDTTPERALDALEAMQGSRAKSFVKPQQNLRLRDIQETTGFLIKDDATTGPRCVRMQSIVDAVTCPAGHFARSSQEIVQECNVTGLTCYDKDCICSPCVEAFEVDFFPVDDAMQDKNETTSSLVGSGCSKFSICGNVQQEHSLTFHAIDNMARPGTTMTGAWLNSDETEDVFTFDNVNGTFEYEFFASRTRVGPKIVKIRINDEEIPESPFRIIVVKRDCEADTGDSSREADPWGECVCKSGMVELFDQCIPLVILIPCIVGPALILFLLAVQVYVRYKRAQSDNIWKVEPHELEFDDTPRVLGRGTFGLVLLAEYRGTQVAVKRVLPVGKKKRSGSMSLTGSVQTSVSHFEGMGSVQSLSNVGMDSTASGVSLGNSSSNSAGSKSGGSDDGDGMAAGPLFWRTKKARLQEEFIDEMRLLSKLRHPSITTVMGAVISSKSEPMMVMEYMHFGALYDLLHNECMILEGALLVGILQDVASGLRFLHSMDPLVLHGDLKAKNILVDDKFRAKVADFGLSRKGYFKKDKARGTPYWMAPELLRGETANTRESDVYAFGVVLYEVFSRKEPYAGETYDDVIRLVSSETVNKRPPVPDNCPEEAAVMMKACMLGDPAARPTATDLDIRLRLMDGASVMSYDMLTTPKNDSSRTDALLEQLFPSHIAQALKEGRKVEPESHDEVTIVFSDIVGYTDISSKLSATKVSDLLDRLYNEFDHLSERLEVFKVETIGDAYMTVTNLVKSQPHHASLAARFASEAMQIAAKTPIDVDDPSLGFVQCRFGFHSGPVVTHVVGTKNARFSLIGDTVNTASRMESNSKPGKIQCSEDTYNLITKDHDPENHAWFNIEKRGVIHVKGKGDMMTYWIDPMEPSSSVEQPTMATHKVTSPPEEPLPKSTTPQFKKLIEVSSEIDEAVV